tara:strand:- start:334 stop:585 length:252 start_codon:yes stop_codon:yes gene_type:complete
MKPKLKLAPNSKRLYKSSTVVLSTVLVMVSLLEIVQPYLQILAPVISEDLFPWISAGVGIAIGIGRYIQQESLKTEEDTTDAE